MGCTDLRGLHPHLLHRWALRPNHPGRCQASLHSDSGGSYVKQLFIEWRDDLVHGLPVLGVSLVVVIIVVGIFAMLGS